MKATLKLKAIAHILGEEEFEFNSGKLTIIKGPNGSGKSRIVNSIAAIESLPIKSENLINEALKLKVGDTLINNTLDSAEVEIQLGKNSKKLVLHKNKNDEISSEGNENFLYTSILHEKSRINNTVLEKNPDFSWILEELSLAKFYEVIYGITNSYIEQCDIFLTEIQKNENLITEDYENIETIQKHNKNLEDKIKSIEKKMGNIEEVDKEIVIEYQGLGKRIKGYNDEIKENEGQIKSAHDDIEKIDSDINLKLNFMEENQKNLNLLGKQQGELTTIKKKINEINETIIKYGEEEKEFLVPKAKFEDKIKSLVDKIKVKSDNCPLCGAPWEFDPKKMEADLKQSNIELKKIKSKISAINKNKKEEENRKKKLDELPDINEQYKRLFEENSQQRVKIKSLEDKKNAIELRVKSFKTVIEEINPKLEEVYKKHKELEDIISANEIFKELAEEKSKISKELGITIEKEEKIKATIEDLSSFEIWGIIIDNLLKAKELIITLKTEIEEIQQFVGEKSKEQKQGVAGKFNENIKDYLDQMQFSQFENVLFDLKDYHLKVFTERDTVQEVNTLSNAEKLVTLSLLQIFLKETYTPDTPFYLVDEVFSSLDEIRKPLFLTYLKNVAEKNDWFVILTIPEGDNLEIIEY